VAAAFVPIRDIRVSHPRNLWPPLTRQGCPDDTVQPLPSSPQALVFQPELTFPAARPRLPAKAQTLLLPDNLLPDRLAP